MFDQLKDRWIVEQFLLFRSDKTFSKLYDRHSEALFRMAMQVTEGNKEQSEDLVQTTWMKAVQKLAGFRWESSLRTWLLSILIFSSKEYFRKFREFKQWDAGKDQRSSFVPLQDGFDLEKAIKNLPPGYKMVLILHDVEGYKHHEISRLLGINEGTSKSQLFHARKMVRNYLSN